jgi:predicted metal-dependent HD superfamily phosphohydrolase
LLQETFTQLCLQFTTDVGLIGQCWQQLQKNYGSKKRHYHNWQHIQAMLQQLDAAKHLLFDYHTVVFAGFYHDAVYNVLKHNNEIKSAELAVLHLAQMQVPFLLQQECAQLILATQHHALSGNSDCNYFTDADLSILGSPPTVYQRYVVAIRKEYAIYPDILYNKGRQKALSHFLQMDRIFKTDFFVERYEAQARENVEGELAMLNR